MHKVRHVVVIMQANRSDDGAAARGLTSEKPAILAGLADDVDLSRSPSRPS